MHVRLQFLQPLLVLDAEMLLFIDDEQTEILELDRVAEQRMRADDNIDSSFFQPFLGSSKLLRADKTRGMGKIDRQAMEALREGLEMLARQERCRHDYRHLNATHRRNEGSTQGYFRLAEADITTDQAIHRLASSQIVRHGLDCRQLVVGFIIGEASRKFGIETIWRRHHRRTAHLPFGSDLDQMPGNLKQAFLELGLAHLPCAAAKLVENSIGAFRTVARQKLDIFDRQKQPVIARIVNFKTVVGSASGGNGLEANEATDTVIDMDDDIASV